MVFSMCFCFLDAASSLPYFGCYQEDFLFVTSSIPGRPSSDELLEYGCLEITANDASCGGVAIEPTTYIALMLWAQSFSLCRGDGDAGKAGKTIPEPPKHSLLSHFLGSRQSRGIPKGTAAGISCRVIVRCKWRL